VIKTTIKSELAEFVEDNQNVFYTNSEWNGFYDPKERKAGLGGYVYKPKGLWYSVGNSWAEWCHGNDWHLGQIVYKIFVDYDKIIHLSSHEQLKDFSEKYNKKAIVGITSLDLGSRYDNIDWEKVYEKFNGIEISPYLYDYEKTPFWYYGWDCASGCIWNKNAIKKVELLEDYRS
jgi:hypothetical protein